jgi:hypothetical protein
VNPEEPLLLPQCQHSELISTTLSQDRFGGLRSAGEQAMIGEELEHQAVEQPRLFDLTSMAGAW